jgi:hypothetical protein
MTHMFVMRCHKTALGRLTKIEHPGTNGQVERMNRTKLLSSATITIGMSGSKVILSILSTHTTGTSTSADVRLNQADTGLKIDEIGNRGG